METNQMDIDLIDLMNERNQQLRKITETRWNAWDEIYLSDSEWFILSLAYEEGKTVVAELTKCMEISRQATHKLIRNLADKGLVTIGQLRNNRKAKFIQLTSKGIKCYEKRKVLKTELEEEITSKLGEENLNKLKEILQTGWGI